MSVRARVREWMLGLAADVTIDQRRMLHDAGLRVDYLWVRPRRLSGGIPPLLHILDPQPCEDRPWMPYNDIFAVLPRVCVLGGEGITRCTYDLGKEHGVFQVDFPGTDFY